MPLSGMLTCGSCGARTQVSTMRYNITGTRLICQSCVEKERGSIKPGTTHSSSVRLREQMRRDLNEKTENPEGEVIATAENSGMAGYYCRSCHFKFSRKKEMDVTSCPYCGRESVGQQYSGKAQDLIEESAEAEENRFF